MKLAKIAAWGLAAAVLPLFAVDSSNTFGMLCVESRTANTLLSVPWLGTDGTSVKVADIVKTDNLTAGDQLLVYNQGTTNYSMWVLSEDGAWTPTKTAALSGTGVASEAIAPGKTAATLNRGAALWLVRKNPNANFYTFGACSVSETVAAEIPVGMSLQAAPIAAAYSVNAGTWTNINTNDQIIVPSFTGGASTILVRKETSKDKWEWRKVVQTSTWSDALKCYVTTKTDAAPDNLPAGSGFWYKSTDVSIRPTVSWPEN